MMVCPFDENRLLLILQVDHSKVAGWFAAHWGNEAFARRAPYAAMIMAAQEHDTGWWDWEIKPQLNSEGLPPDYIGSIKHLGGKVWLNCYRHGIDVSPTSIRLSYRSRAGWYPSAATKIRKNSSRSTMARNGWRSAIRSIRSNAYGDFLR